MRRQRRESAVRGLGWRSTLILLAATAALAACNGPTVAGKDVATKSTSLPAPRTDGTFSVERALQQRRSVRAFGDEALTLEELGQLLWAAQGVSGVGGLRTAPSAGALYPLELTVIAGKVSGLPAGLYRYEPAGHRLAPLAAGDRRGEVARAALAQSWMRTAPAMIAFGAVEARTTRKYGTRGVAYVRIELGHAAQNVFLQAQALGLGAAVVGAFDDAALAAALQMSPDETPLYLMPVGREGTEARY
jgi:SagB-type dehydrogenase family enzyme